MADQLPEWLEAGTQVDPIRLAATRIAALCRLPPEAAKTAQNAAPGGRVGKGGESEAAGRRSLRKGGQASAGVAGNEVASEIQGEDVAGRRASLQRMSRDVLVEIEPENAIAIKRRSFENVYRLDA